jgi:hypothetical protein
MNIEKFYQNILKRKKVKIGAYEFKILFPYNFREVNDIRGSSRTDFLEIRIADNSDGRKYPPDTIYETLQHEILHMINNIYNNYRISEEDITLLSQALYQVFKDNEESSVNSEHSNQVNIDIHQS